MIVVLPFFSGDESLAHKNILWMQKLDPKIDADCVLAYDYQTKPDRIASVAGQIFRKVHLYTYKPPPDPKWPRASNWVFQHVAWHMHGNFKEPWLWLESDCVPVRAGWYRAIKECHERAGKPFTGHWNEKTKVWNGVSVYPPNTPHYGQNLMLAQNNPWDVWASKDVAPHLNIANHLFQHIWHDEQTQEAFTFPNQETVRRVIRPGVYLFHRCKDGSLIDRLERGDSLDLPTATFAHGGDVGDLIYALPTMRALGGGTLSLCHFKVREPFSEQKANRIIPLLRLQPYLREVYFSPDPPHTTYNFNNFRKRLRPGVTLALAQSEMFGLNGGTTADPWITVDRPVYAGDYSVIFHRSARYQNPKFPWKQAVKQYGHKALFVGMEREWQSFTKAFGKVEYHPTADFLELARLIAGAKLFVGNQSSPYSIAEGLKKPALLESCPKALDCQFTRANLQNDPNGKVVLPEI